jgi:hypothetical protein
LICLLVNPSNMEVVFAVQDTLAETRVKSV